MRPLRFRCWDTLLKTMWDVTELSWRPPEQGRQLFYIRGMVTANGKRQPIGGNGDHIDLSRFILMQFTGLTDRYGTEIWEGDVVQGINGLKGGPSEVFYEYGVWQPFAFLGNYNGQQFEVLGNIHEHPTLLTKEAST